MASAARLERLNKLVQADLDALPDRPPPPAPESEAVSDDDASGGVNLEAGSGPSAQPLDSQGHENKRPLPDVPTQALAELRVTSPPPPEENSERRFVWAQGAVSSYNLGSTQKLAALPTHPLPPADIRKGDLTHPRQQFAPILAVSKYPYRFCNPDCMQDIASFAFDAGKFWAREWDLYYVRDIESSKPLILIREEQFQDLLIELNSALKLRLKITDQQREESLVSRFPDHPRTLPRYLGRSHSREEYDEMASNVPSESFRAESEPPPGPLGDTTLEAFKQMIEEMWDLTKNKNKAKKEKSKQDRLARQQVTVDEFKRTQRYLGLRPSAQEGQANPTLPPPIDPALSAPFQFYLDVVFVSVDVESFERAHHKITEVGIASLDTRDLCNLPPGKDGEMWRSKINARHFRIEEHKHLINHDFVSGCPDRFEFGESEFVRLKDAAEAIRTCFMPPFCAPSRDGATGTADIGEARPIIFLGHDTLTDVKYLQQLGFNPLDLRNVKESVDTANMYRVWKREQNTTKLGNILYHFDITGWNLHNAGNDAVYTVQAMLGISVREASIRGTPALSAEREEEKAARLAAAQEEAKEKAQEAEEGWSDNEASGDGGDPVPIVIKETPKPVSAGDPSNPEFGRGRGRGQGVDQSRGGYGNHWRGTSDSSSSYSERGRREHRGDYAGEQISSGRSFPHGFTPGRFHSESRGYGRYRGPDINRGRGQGGVHNPTSNTANRPGGDHTSGASDDNANHDPIDIRKDLW